MPGSAAASNGERRGPVSNPWAASDSELREIASGSGLKSELQQSDPRPALAAVQAMLLQRPAELLEALAGRVLPALAAGCSAGRAPDPTPGAEPGHGAYPGQIRAVPGALAAALALAEESVRLGGASGVQVRRLSVHHAMILSYIWQVHDLWALTEDFAVLPRQSPYAAANKRPGGRVCMTHLRVHWLFRKPPLTIRKAGGRGACH